MKVLITSALPYANGPLHFGHIAGAYLPADCFARFSRLKGDDVLFISGSDEYGMAITLSAELAGRTPKEQASHFHEVNRRFFEQLDLSFDHFSKTTIDEHGPIVQEFFLDLVEAGYIEPRESEQLYSEEEKRFLADRYVVGICPSCGYEEARGDECGRCGASYEATDLKEPRSKLTNSPLTKRTTTHWFLLFDRLQTELKSFFNARRWKPNVERFARHYLEEIKARAITRDLDWGVPVPLKEAAGKVFYVWFDAPIGYLSATKEWDPKRWEEYWLDPDTHYVQFIGKDNIPFHALFFPAMILGQKKPYKLVDELVANEFYNLEGRQFSKSDGWIIDLEDFFEKFSADQIRYTIAANLPETADAEFTWKDFQQRCNGELLGKLGNLVNRVFVFAFKNCGGCVPEVGTLEEVDLRLQNEMDRLMSEIEQAYSQHRIRQVTQLVMEFASVGNRYFDQKAPWKDARDEKTRPMMETTIALCLEVVKCLALALSPIVPTTANKIWKMLGKKGTLQENLWEEVVEEKMEAKSALQEPERLFEKIEDSVIEEEIVKLNEMHEEANKETHYEPLKEQIGIEDFFKLDLRVAKVTKAEKLPKSKKLLLLEVDLGFETRQIVSGISQHYAPEEMVGKKVIVVANLKPAKLMGVESQGMLLAGSLEGELEIPTLTNLPIGAKIS